ncbi:MAG: phosphate propanoyltransferase [Clostridiales Family XIII bacterium]|nr:phosphate propanoyltransferase [Clostridiales Family XIII bacterium]
MGAVIGDEKIVPVGVSGRHLHLSQSDLDLLFGPNYELTSIKNLSQPGQFACKETVTICGPKGCLEKVRILGPVRPETQVELLSGDCFKLGIGICIRMSGDLRASPAITIVGPKGSVYKSEGAIVAKRHIHMTPADASTYGVTDGQIVNLSVEGERGGVLREVIVRVSNTAALDCHVDTEEANALGINSSTVVKLY